MDDKPKSDVRLEITRLMKELMESADSVHVAPVQLSCKKKNKTALDIGSFLVKKEMMILMMVVKMKSASILLGKWLPGILIPCKTER